jgi:putative membrane protein
MTHKRITITLLIVFSVLMAYSVIAIPLDWPRPHFLTSLNTMVGFSAAFSHAWQRMGLKRTLTLLACSFVVSLAFESIGVATGLVYGPYHYTDKLGPKFLGLVPYLIAIAWFLMMYPSYVIADRLVGKKLTGWKRFLLVAALGGLTMTAWDVGMDPMMVANGHWVWEVNGAYFGVPLQNYWGWWLTVFTTFTVYLFLMRDARLLNDKRFDRLAILVYIATGLGNLLQGYFIGLGGAALAGFFAMTPWVITGWLSTSD